MEIIFKGRQTDVATRFRDQATAKLLKLEKLDQKTIRVDVEVSVERNPRQSSQKERVELTIISRGPAIRAEAAAEDRFAALDLALAKLDSRLRRALDRRKRHNAGQRSDGQLAGPPGSPSPSSVPAPSSTPAPDAAPASRAAAPAGRAAGSAAPASPNLARSMPRQTISRPGKSGSPDGVDPVPSDSVVPIEMEGDGPLVVRQKFHRAAPIPIDQALLEMELVGHDFYLFHDIDEDMPSVVYRRRGYQYGVIRLVEGRSASGSAAVPESRRPTRSEVADGDLAGQSAGQPAGRSQAMSSADRLQS
ncbi:MAG TPA: ribosome-associated translation inhibitor RaiA [Streptosporangiaceae bacterium]|jgi:ribosomal subunit interface protein